MTTDKLCCGVYYYVCTVLDWSYKIRCCKCIINNKRNLMLVRNLCNFLNINNLWVWISQRLDENQLCILLDSALNLFIIKWIYECCVDTIWYKCMCQQIVGTTIDIFCCNNMITCKCQILDCICNSCCARSNCKCCNTTLKAGNSLLKYILSRISQSSVNVAGIL